MFTVTVELLTGRYVATEFNDRSAPEWPPHPARLFSAAVAAWADHGDEDTAERAALQWWEALEPPSISCSLGERELAAREVVTHFVPVNDTSVVARDTVRSYEQLLDSERAMLDESLDDREVAKAAKRLDKARTKASVDSKKVTSGVAPLDRLGILPPQRAKQPRTYPTMAPANPMVSYHWSVDAKDSGVDGHLAVLDALLGRVARLGHSSTPVSISLNADVDPSQLEVTLEPGDARRSLGLRVVTRGQLDKLIGKYAESAQGTEPRIMPAASVPYRRPGKDTSPRASMIGERWIVLEPRKPSRLMVQDVPAVTKTLRSALMSVCGESGAAIPEFLSGHRPPVNGATGPTEPSLAAHLMILGLPFAGQRHATGEVMGLALVLPTLDEQGESAGSDWLLLRDVVRRFVENHGGRLTFRGGGRPVTLQAAELGSMPETMRARRWSGPSDDWVSVTPIALDRNPGRLGHADATKRAAAESKAAEIIAVSCERIGLPRPVNVEVLLDAPTQGTRPVHVFPPARTGRLTRVQVHARITFAEPVRGPMVLGAGRFHGLGLCAPVRRTGGQVQAVAL